MTNGRRFHPSGLRLMVLAGLGATVLLLSRPVAAQEGKCPKCVNAITCTLVNESTTVGSCSVDRTGCSETMGYCVAVDNGGHGLALKHGESRKMLTSDGPVRLAAVDEGYFAAWTCAGEVVHLYKEEPSSGEMIPIRDRFALARYRMPVPPANEGRAPVSS